MRINIKDYQRVEEVDFELEPGINVINGESNNGKSSIMRAIRDFIFNSFTNEKVRHGQKSLSVSIDDATGNRNKKGTTYEIGEEHFEKIGRNKLPEIFDKFKVGELEVNKVKVKPNFWLQMDKPFLFDKTPNQRGELILGSRDSDKYLNALKNIKSNQNYMNRTEKKSISDSLDLLKKQNLDLKENIDNTEGVDELFKEISILENEETKVNEILNLVSNLTSEFKKKKEAFTTLDRINKILSVGKKYQEYIDKVYQMDEVVEVYDNIVSREELEGNYKDEVIQLLKLIEEGEIIDVSEDEEAKSKLKRISDLIVGAKGLDGDTERLQHELGTINKEVITVASNMEDAKKELGVCPICDKEF